MTRMDWESARRYTTSLPSGLELQAETFVNNYRGSNAFIKKLKGKTRFTDRQLAVIAEIRYEESVRA